jgi:hypothetical protein
MRISAALLAPVLALAGDAPEGPLDPALFAVEPAAATWEELSAGPFDPRWILPERRSEGLDLTARLLELAELEFDLPHPDDDGRRLTTLGDLVVAARELPVGERARFADRALAADRELARRWGLPLRQLLDDSRLHTSRWDPDEDSDADGLLLASAWELPKEREPWRSVGVDLVAEQGAVLVHADLTTFKEVENDYSVYPDDVGAQYEEIGPVPGSRLVGEDPEGRPFQALRLEFGADLPFPFGGYECDLRVLNRLRADGRVETHIYTPGGDFHWMAGRDLFLPVHTGAGEPVGLLVARVYGFDLDGVPDGRDHRKAALRGRLGNLKRKAEARFRALGARWRDTEGELPDYRVIGRR